MIDCIKYTLKVWLTTLIVVAVCFALIRYINTYTEPDAFYNMLRSFVLCAALSFFGSCVTWLVSLICVFNILKQNWPTKKNKQIIRLLALMLAPATFSVYAAMFGGVPAILDWFFLALIAVYTSLSLLCIHFYKLPQFYTDIE